MNNKTFITTDDVAEILGVSKSYAYKMFGTNEAEDLYFATSSKKIGDGFKEQVNGFINKHPSAGLIIVDTLKRVRKSTGEYS
ncbi:MAG: helix-turn-helix domain-containing protein [Oscillospiraceae bacterium]|nr:helix-turn-helix domain-containing protein [Oscillospiraceae bacterium]